MNPTRMMQAALLALATFGAQAQGTLAERRLAITKGTAPGKVVLDLPPLGTGASASASAPAGAASGNAAAPLRSGLFSRLPPPSGKSLQAARRLDAPDQGIVIKPAP